MGEPFVVLPVALAAIVTVSLAFLVGHHLRVRLVKARSSPSDPTAVAAASSKSTDRHHVVTSSEVADLLQQCPAHGGGSSGSHTTTTTSSSATAASGSGTHVSSMMHFDLTADLASSAGGKPAARVNLNSFQPTSQTLSRHHHQLYPDVSDYSLPRDHTQHQHYNSRAAGVVSSGYPYSQVGTLPRNAALMRQPGVVVVGTPPYHRQMVQAEDIALPSYTPPRPNILQRMGSHLDGSDLYLSRQQQSGGGDDSSSNYASVVSSTENDHKKSSTPTEARRSKSSRPTAAAPILRNKPEFMAMSQIYAKHHQ